jgi:predicted dehydrogenase/nucleoside-diphosphate-sugar epimerase
LSAAQSVRPPAPFSVAVIGCGAVTQHYHLPVLAGHERFRIAALVDPDTARAQHLAALYDVPLVFPAAGQIGPDIADGALIATPPALHVRGAIELTRRGMHVLVEKPMALSVTDAERVVAAARERGAVLSVGLFRRLIPAIRLFRAALDAGQIGNVLAIDAEVGSAYTWQAATLAGMRRDEAGGGVLVDMGSHILDLLLYVCNAAPELVEYSDNASSGIETDCLVSLGLRRGDDAVPARVELSRTRTLRNSIRAEGSGGVLEWRFGERSRLEFRPPRTFLDPVGGAARPCVMEARWRDDVEQDGYEGFREQLDDWLDAIRDGRQPELSGESTIPTVKLIEECYARRLPTPEPWFSESLPRGTIANRLARGAEGRVLVSGASGFIGCRLSERLHFGSDWQVRALIRGPGRAVRLARMPIELAVGDLTRRADLAKALEGCNAVVHCGIGTSWRRSERFATTVKGTRNLVDAALDAGVKRFVHLSTTAIYGDPTTGALTEQTPVNPGKGSDYAESKYAAEQIVLEAASRGLPAIVLRIATVYGAHNMTIVTRPLQHLLQDRLVLVDCRDVPSNTIYIDNLCHGIQLALEAPSHLNGQIFVLSDDDGFTWGEFFGFFADRIGANVHHVARDELGKRAMAASTPTLRRWFGSTRDLITSTETKALARRIYQSEPWGTPARWFVDRFPQAAERLKRVARPETAFVYRPRPVVESDAAPFRLTPISARVRTDKARQVLGFEPVVPRLRALELTLAWARYARIVPAAAYEERADR